MNYRKTLSTLPSNLPQKIDLFICSASFEDRCLSIARHLDYSRIENTLLCFNRESEGMFLENLTSLREQVGVKRIEARLSREQPLATLDTLLQSIQNTRKSVPMNYLVDVTTFTHETLLVLLKILFLLTTKEDSIRLVYAPAKDYAGETSSKQQWLTKGIRDIRAVLGYPGAIFPYRKTHLMILVGHEWERAEKLIQKFEATTVTLGVGGKADSLSSSHYKTNLIHFERLRSIYGKVRSFEFSCNDPCKTALAISSQLDAIGDDYDTVISPMNTKLSTIGAAFAAIHNPKLQLCYAQAMIYNVGNYSTPGNDFFDYDFWELYESIANAQIPESGLLAIAM